MSIIVMGVDIPEDSVIAQTSAYTAGATTVPT